MAAESSQLVYASSSIGTGSQTRRILPWTVGRPPSAPKSSSAWAYLQLVSSISNRSSTVSNPALSEATTCVAAAVISHLEALGQRRTLFRWTKWAEANQRIQAVWANPTMRQELKGATQRTGTTPIVRVAKLKSSKRQGRLLWSLFQMFTVLYHTVRTRYINNDCLIAWTYEGTSTKATAMLGWFQACLGKDFPPFEMNFNHSGVAQGTSRVPLK